MTAKKKRPPPRTATPGYFFRELAAMTKERDEWRQAAGVEAGLRREAMAERNAARAPITMQDIRLAAGEGPLSAHDVLAAANAVIRSRSR